MSNPRRDRPRASGSTGRQSAAPLRARASDGRGNAPRQQPADGRNTVPRQSADGRGSARQWWDGRGATSRQSGALPPRGTVPTGAGGPYDAGRRTGDRNGLPRRSSGPSRPPESYDREYLVAASARPVDTSALWSGGRDTGGARSLRVQPGGSEKSARSPGSGQVAVAEGLGEQQRPRPSWFARFMLRYGWRAYAMPVLIALTVVTVIEISKSPTSGSPASGTVVAASTLVSDPAVSNAGASATSANPTGRASDPAADVAASEAAGANVLSAPNGQPAVAAPSEPESAESADPATAPGAADGPSAALAVGALPDGDPFTESGNGTFRVVPGAGAKAGTSATVVTYTVEIENGVEPAGGDAAFAAAVDATLADPRSWTTVKGVSLQRLDAADAGPDFRVTLGSQQTVRGMCGYAVHLESSCFTRGEGRVMINDARWVRGALSYHGDLAAYRQYAVNHEVGHALGYGHEPCPANGGTAPVMMQQSWSTSNNELAAINGSVTANGNTCVANPWPDPTAQAAAPAADPATGGADGTGGGGATPGADAQVGAQTQPTG